MEINIDLLPKKFNEINYFKKTETGCEIYSYSKDIANRRDVIIVELDGFEIKQEFCVNNKALEMVKALSPADISITDKSFIIKGKKGRFTSKLITDNFFNMNIDDDNICVNVDIDILTKASLYVCKNDKKPILTGVRLDSNRNIYATDSFVAYLYSNGEFTTDGITLPVSFINNIKELNGEDSSNIEIVYKKNIAMFQKNNIKILTRLLDGSYPNMTGIFGKKNGAVNVKINDEEILDNLNIASNVGLDNDKRIVVSLSQNHLEVCGDNNYTSEIEFNNEDKFKMNVDLNYLRQGFKTIGSGLDFSVLYDELNKNGKMIFLTKDKELSLILGIIGA